MLTDASPQRAVINLNALDAEPSDLPAPARVDFEAETPEARRARRLRTWTPLVSPIPVTGDAAPLASDTLAPVRLDPDDNLIELCNDAAT